MYRLADTSARRAGGSATHMSSTLATCRRIAALLAPWLAVVALVASLTGALHHHGADGPHAPCAVCTHGAAPAIAASAATVAGAPLSRAERSVTADVPAPPARARATDLSRAPPLA